MPRLRTVTLQVLPDLDSRRQAIELSTRRLKPIGTCGKLTAAAATAAGRAPSPGASVTVEPVRQVDRDGGDRALDDSRHSLRKSGAPNSADRAPLMGIRQLRDAIQGFRAEGRPADRLREDRRRGPGSSVHGRRAHRRAPHPMGPCRRLPGSGAARGGAGRRPRHDQLEHLPGRRLHARQRLPPGGTRPTEGGRPPARVHRHHGRDRVTRPQAVVRGRDQLPRAGRHSRSSGPAGRGVAGGLRAARPGPANGPGVQALRARLLLTPTCRTGARRSPIAWP